MVEETTVLELRKDAALLACFPVKGIPFGFTTIQDEDTNEHLSWVFVGDVNCDENTEGTPYVIGRIFADKHSSQLMIITWLPSFSISFFLAFE